MPINRFRGKYYFLSNFYPCRNGVEFDGDLFPTSEHAYQAAKIEERSGRESFTIDGSLGQSGPMVAKMKGKHVDKRPSWDSNKVKFMEVIVRSKFARDPKLTKDLLDTADKKVVEGHTGDKFWGGKANHLGNILMKMRQEARLSQAYAGQQPQEPVADEIEASKPFRKQNKGHTFEVIVAHGEDALVFWADAMGQFGDILDLWCHKQCVESGQIQFNVLEPAQAVDRESHLFDYADIHRQVFITACCNEDLRHQRMDASHNIENAPPLQPEKPHSGLPPHFASWVHDGLRKEKPEEADGLFDCVWTFVADVAGEDLIAQLNEASSFLKGEGAPIVADELAAQWYASSW